MIFLPDNIIANLKIEDVIVQKKTIAFLTDIFNADTKSQGFSLSRYPETEIHVRAIQRSFNTSHSLSFNEQ